MAYSAAHNLANLATMRLGPKYLQVTPEEIWNLFQIDQLTGDELLKLETLIRDEEVNFPREGSADNGHPGIRYEWSYDNNDNNLVLSIVFVVDELAKKGPGFPELNFLPEFVESLKLLGIEMKFDSVPIFKPTHSPHLWCKLNARFETPSRPTPKQYAYAMRHFYFPGLSSLKKLPEKICVRFILEGGIDTIAPWGSAPFLHTGPNYRIPGEGDDESVCCFIYDQKKPTLEIPSKLNEVSYIIGGFVNDTHRLFKFREIKRSLAICMAICHPKTRLQILTSAFVMCYLPKTELNKNDKSAIKWMRFAPGKDVNIRSVEEASIKLSLETRACQACNRMCNKMGCDDDRYCHPVHTHDSFSVQPEYEHGNCKKLAVAHHFFCDGVVPCAVESIMDDRTKEKTKLVVCGKTWGKVKDNGECMWTSFNGKKSNYFDLLVRKCDTAAARRYFNTCFARTFKAGMERWLPFMWGNVNIINQSRAYLDLKEKNHDDDVIFHVATANFEHTKSRVLNNNKNDNNTNVSTGLVRTLRTLEDQKEARILTLMNKCVVVASRMVISGFRGTLNPDAFDFHQFIVTSNGMVVAPVSSRALERVYIDCKTFRDPVHRLKI